MEYSKYLARVVAWSQEGERPRVFPRKKLAWMGAAATLGFAMAAVAVVTDQSASIDMRLTLALHARANAALDHVMHLVTLLGALPVIGALVVASVLLLVRAHRRWDALVLGTVMAIQGAIDDVVKLFLHRPRPLFFPRPPAAGFSFPSGHAMATLCLASVLVALGWPRLSIPLRWITVTLLAIVVMGVGLSRVYLGVHTPSDVLGGWLAGAAWLGFAPAVLRRMASASGMQRTPRRKAD